MKILTKEFTISTDGNCDMKDLTNEVQAKVNESNLKEGNCTIMSIGSTASITTIEYEPGLIKDMSRVMEKLIPAYSQYYHNDTWGDSNGHSHIRSSIIGTSFNVPFVNGELILGTWQKIVLIDFDNRKRTRRIIVQMIGE